MNILKNDKDRNKFTKLIIKDGRFRTVVVTLPGMAVNLSFAVFNLIIYITTQSIWYLPLFVYYTALYFMRFISLIYAKQIYTGKIAIENGKKRELNIYFINGIILSVLSFVLIGTVIMSIMGVGGKYYQKALIYIVGSYTFLKLILSVRNMVEAKKENSVLQMNLRYIGYSDALVSLLFLQTALAASYEWSPDGLILLINAVLGSVVWVTALVVGLIMTFDAKRRFRED